MISAHDLKSRLAGGFLGKPGGREFIPEYANAVGAHHALQLNGVNAVNTAGVDDSRLDGVDGQVSIYSFTFTVPLVVFSAPSSSCALGYTLNNQVGGIPFW